MIVKKDQFLIMSLFDQEMNHSIFKNVASNPLQTVKFFDISMLPIYRVSSHC